MAAAESGLAHSAEKSNSLHVAFAEQSASQSCHYEFVKGITSQSTGRE